MDREQRLVAAGWLFAIGSAIHVFDHARRGQDSVTDALRVAGMLALVVQGTVVALILTRHRWAPRVSAVAGPVLAVGFFSAHWLPHWSALSDPVWQIGSPFSYVASALEILGAAAVGAAGLATTWVATGRRSFSRT